MEKNEALYSKMNTWLGGRGVGKKITWISLFFFLAMLSLCFVNLS